MHLSIELTSKSLSAWRALLICPTDGMRQAFAGALNEESIRNIVEVSEYPYLSCLDPLIACCDICFLDAAAEASLALRLLVRISGAGVPVLVLHPSPDSDFTLDCLRRGAADVLPFPEERPKLRAMLDKAAARLHFSSAPVHPAGVVYGVMAGKGGSGSTTVATHMALRLAKERPGKVLLADLDGVGGTVGFLLRRKPAFSARDLAAEIGRMDEDLWRTMVVKVDALDLLLAPIDPTQFSLSETCLLRIMDLWRSIYDCVIVDLPTCHSEVGMTTARLVDLLLLVTRCELTAFHSTIRTIAYLEQNEVRTESIKVALNGQDETNLWCETPRAALGNRILGQISFAEPMLRKAVLQGTPVPPASTYADEIAALAQSVTGWPIQRSQKVDLKSKCMRLFKGMGKQACAEKDDGPFRCSSPGSAH